MQTKRQGPKPEIFDEDGFMIVQDVPFDQLVWVEVTKLDGKKARPCLAFDSFPVFLEKEKQSKASR